VSGGISLDLLGTAVQLDCSDIPDMALNALFDLPGRAGCDDWFVRNSGCVMGFPSIRAAAPGQNRPSSVSAVLSRACSTV
jgi:hypothetical protein